MTKKMLLWKELILIVDGITPQYYSAFVQGSRSSFNNVQQNALVAVFNVYHVHTESTLEGLSNQQNYNFILL